jgi:pimeloyl-ACP methyl ester carboxylesterase
LRRGWKILIAVVAVLAVLLALNTVSIDNETGSAGVTADGGQILELSAGDVQVVDEGPTAGGRQGPPIVLLHCYSCSLQWWDRLAPLLSERHRVVRLDLLGHGGSEKPESGYSMEEQGALVAEALNRLEVEGATVVGHSMGATVATALAAESSELVDRLVVVDQAPDNSFGGLPFIARLAYIPVLGQLLDRITPDFAVKDGYADAFAPDYDLESGFENPDQVVDDFNAMTYTSFDDSADGEDEYVEEIPLDDRITNAAIPLLVIFGDEEQIYDTDEAVAAYEDVPGVRTAIVEGAGHSPNVERPEETARLILEFANEAGDEAEVPQPPRRGQGPKNGGGEQKGNRGKRAGGKSTNGGNEGNGDRGKRARGKRTNGGNEGNGGD